nr:aminotransferase class I/II-fold pyridoxal phosphate-dependent enzyme [Lachnospiraceae bacterium]
FDVHPENIIVGNGAAELIKSLMEHLNGLTGVVRPTFEEYPNRYDDRDLVVFEPDRSDLQYGVDDLIAFFEGTDIKNLILINPDNPTGNYIPKKDLLRLITWADNKNIRLVIDESFADFAEDGKITQTRQEMLDRYKRLYFMKSISKSHGVPGLRLGILMSGDLELIAEMKNDVAIWNINSFAEFYMQIMEKYRADHAQGIQKLISERKYFIEKLKEIQGIRALPSQANYVMVELTNGIFAKTLTRNLLVRHNIFIKDLSGKIKSGRYIRLAIMDREKNDRLLEALKREMNES